MLANIDRHTKKKRTPPARGCVCVCVCVRVCVCHSVRFKVCCDGRRPTVLTHLNSGSGWYVDVTVVIGAVVAGKDVDTLGAVGAEHGLEERQHVVPEEEGEETLY